MEKLLIAVHSDMFADALAAAFRKEYSIRTCTDGCDALELLNTFQPDLLILYLRLPRKDGITILTETSHTPEIILGIIDHTTPFIERQAELAGIDTLMILPTVNAVTVRLTQIQLARGGQNRQDLQLQTSLLLHSLGVNAKLDGWDMLLVGIPLFAEDPRQVLGKVLYPAIAKIVGCSDGRAVEHSIRDCIKKAWLRRDHFVWVKHFPADRNGKIPCPSNSQFIKALARAIRL